jgi:hypothetical protein
MRWPQRVRTVNIHRMSECKRGFVFLPFLQETGFLLIKTLVYMNVFQSSAGWCMQPAFT